ncbi:hypothetical protein BJV74DRAFT_794274 [Russula compacta]|nr:hypothetical protein BJV74DRAFT_794274 [Russula compacta]
MPTLPATPSHDARITAPLLLGALWNWCLYGALIVQCLFAIFLLETAQTALSCADLFYWFISGYDNPAHLTSPYMGAIDVPIIASVVSLVVQFFYAYRIWILSAKQSGWFCLLICLFSTIDAAAAFTGGIYTHIHDKFAHGGKLKAIGIIWLIGNAISDILIASAMFYHLAKRRKDVNGVFGDHALVKIVSASVGVLSVLLILIYPLENWYICPKTVRYMPLFCLESTYSNTLLVSLNNRISIRRTATIQGVANRTPAVNPTPAPRPRSSTYITLMEIEQPPTAYKLYPRGEREWESRP